MPGMRCSSSHCIGTSADSVGFEPSLLHHTRILKTGDQRLAREIGRMSPKIEKIAPQRFRNVSLTRGNVAAIFGNRMLLP